MNIYFYENFFYLRVWSFDRTRIIFPDILTLINMMKINLDEE